MPAADFTAIFLILIGPFIGSFLALLADRLPRGENVVTSPSTCRSCGTRLGLRDLLPVLAFALNRGRCRHCGAAIPAVTLYTEIAASGAAVLAVLAGGDAVQMWLTALFLWLLLVLAVTDLIWFRLPDLLTGGLFLVALALAWREGRLDMALIGAAVGAGSFLALRVGYRALRGREGLGLGDVKLMAGIGAFAGPADLPSLLLIAALGALSVVLLLQVISDERESRELWSRRLPFGAALCAATALLWLLDALAG